MTILSISGVQSLPLGARPRARGGPGRGRLRAGPVLDAPVPEYGFDETIYYDIYELLPDTYTAALTQGLKRILIFQAVLFQSRACLQPTHGLKQILIF